MKFSLGGIVVGAFLFSASWTSVEGTPIEWKVSDGGNGHLYELTEEEGSWAAMNALAESRGGYLASILSMEENSFIRALITATSREFHWIGLNDLAAEGSFVWTSGESFVFSNWFPPAEPNNRGNEDAVEIYSSNGYWNDNRGSKVSHAIIEWGDDQSDIPEPMTFTALLLGTAALMRTRRR